MEKYAFLSVLAEGAYGTVWKCRNKETDEIVAVKKMKEAPKDEQDFEFALREVKLLQALAHINVVRLLEAYQSQSCRLYLVFEFVEHTVLHLIRSHKAGLPAAEVKSIMWQLLQALSYLHHKQIIHRDVKPSNVLIDKQGRVKLCDFGFARPMLEQVVADYTTYVVTRWYRPPEVLVGDSYGPGVDIWALGCIFAELVTGRPLFPGKTHHDQLWLILKSAGQLPDRQLRLLQADEQFACFRMPHSNDIVPLEKRLPGFSSSMMQLLKACLQADPKHRKTADELMMLPYFTGVQDVLPDQSRVGDQNSRGAVCKPNKSQAAHKITKPSSHVTSKAAAAAADCCHATTALAASCLPAHAANSTCLLQQQPVETPVLASVPSSAQPAAITSGQSISSTTTEGTLPLPNIPQHLPKVTQRVVDVIDSSLLEDAEYHMLHRAPQSSQGGFPQLCRALSDVNQLLVHNNDEPCPLADGSLSHPCHVNATAKRLTWHGGSTGGGASGPTGPFTPSLPSIAAGPGIAGALHMQLNAGLGQATVSSDKDHCKHAARRRSRSLTGEQSHHHHYVLAPEACTLAPLGMTKRPVMRVSDVSTSSGGASDCDPRLPPKQPATAGEAATQSVCPQLTCQPDKATNCCIDSSSPSSSWLPAVGSGPVVNYNEGGDTAGHVTANGGRRGSDSADGLGPTAGNQSRLLCTGGRRGSDSAVGLAGVASAALDKASKRLNHAAVLIGHGRSMGLQQQQHTGHVPSTMQRQPISGDGRSCRADRGAEAGIAPSHVASLPGGIGPQGAVISISAGLPPLPSIPSSSSAARLTPRTGVSGVNSTHGTSVTAASTTGSVSGTALLQPAASDDKPHHSDIDTSSKTSEAHSSSHGFVRMSPKPHLVGRTRPSALFPKMGLAYISADMQKMHKYPTSRR